MKLHLPKLLLTAVLAVCVAPAAWADTVTVSSDSSIGSVYVSGETSKIEVTGGTLTFGTTYGISLSEGLVISGGVVTAGTDNGTGFVDNQTDVTINGGGILRLTEKDSLGYNTGATKSVTLKGSEGSIAYMEVGKRQTISTDITMSGYAEIKHSANAVTAADNTDRAALDSWSDNSFTVENTNNTLSAELIIRKDLNIVIKKDGELLLKSKISDGDGDGVLKISGAGTVTLGGDALNCGSTFTVASKVSGEVRNFDSNLTFGDGSTAVTSTVTRLELCDKQNATSSVTIKDKYTLKISGDNNTNNAFSNGALVLAEWGGNSNGTLNIEGVLIAENACAMMAEGTGKLDVKSTGLAVVKGVKDKNTGTKSNVTIAEGGRLVLGDGGLEKTTGTFTSSIAGTIGISANTVIIDRDLTIAGNAAILDTTKYAISEYSVTQGTDGGTLVLKGDLLGSGKVTVNGAGTLQIGGISSAVDLDINCGKVDYLGTLTMETGKTVSFKDGLTVTVSATDMSAFARAGGYEGTDGEVTVSGNGFATGNYALVSGGTVSGEIEVSYGGKNYTVNDANRGFGDSEGTDYSVYALNSGSATVSTVADYAAEKSADVSEYRVAGGTTLNVDEIPAAIKVNGNANLNIAQGLTLNHSAVTIAEDAAATLKGKGAYTISQASVNAAQSAGSSPTGIKIGSDWTGQVNLLATARDNHLSVQWLNLNHYGNANSSIKLKGVSGYLCAANSGDGVKFTSSLIMENSDKAALELTDGCSNDRFTFSGTIKNGANGGNLVKASSVQQNITFSGDISGWTGIIDLLKGGVNNGNISTITFTDKATTINNEVRTRNADGVANEVKATVRFQNDSAVTMNGAVTHSNTNANSKLNLEVATAKGTTFKNSVSLNGKATVESGAKAVFTKGLTAGELSLGESALVVTSSLSDLTLTAGAGSAIIKTSAMPTELTSITVTDSATLQAGGSKSGLGVGLVMVDGSSLTINGEGSVTLGGTLTLGSNITLNQEMLDKITGLNEVNNELVIFSGVTALDRYSASGIALLSAAKAGAIDAADVFNGLAADTYTINLSEGNVSIGMLSVPPPAVPEPTTATLSLLALAALASRRRRK